MNKWVNRAPARRRTDQELRGRSSPWRRFYTCVRTGDGNHHPTRTGPTSYQISDGEGPMSQGTRLEVSRRAGTMFLHATALQQGLPPQLGLRLAVPPLGKLLMSSSSAPVAEGVPLVCSVGIDLEGRGVGLVQTCRWVLAAPATRALRGRRAAPARDDDAPRVAAEPHPCSHGCLPGVGVCLPSSAKARLVRTARDGLHARVDDEPRRVTHAATAAALTALQPLGVAYGKIYSAYGGEQQSVATPQAARGWFVQPVARSSESSERKLRNFS